MEGRARSRGATLTSADGTRPSADGTRPSADAILHVRLLGGFAVSVGDRKIDPAWRLRKAKSLVKLLALAEGRSVHRDVALGTLWPGYGTDSAVNNFHQALHAARRALAGAGADPATVLPMRDQVVVLAPEADVAIDVAGFLAAAGHAQDTGSPADLRTALALYTGDLLPEDEYSDWVLPHRQRLAGVRDSLIVRLAGQLAADGAAEEAVGLIGPLAAARPLDEPLQRAWMSALAAAGRRWDALAAYERVRDTLAQEYAAVPERETRESYRHLVTHQQGAATSAPHNLPTPVTSFIGRSRELAAMEALLDRARLVTLTGPGGAGKTRLALELANRRLGNHRDGVWLVELAGLRGGDLVASAVASSLGLQLSGRRPTPEALGSRLSGRDLLLVLDNCEHLVDACARLAAEVLAQCPAVTVLATSREPLRVAGEVMRRVPSLELPEPADARDPRRLERLEAVQLFAERARDVVPGFRVDAANAAGVARICSRLDGIPLALELAAARLATLPAPELADRLGDALTLLAQRTRGALDRQQTLTAALDWSHELLTESERIVFRRLAVFAGGFSVDAAETVCAGGDVGDPVVEVLARLVDKSLVVADTAGSAGRYRLLEIVRQYAVERLAGAGEQAECVRLHRDFFTARAEELDPDRGGPVVQEPSSDFDLEHDNLRSALASALAEDPPAALRLAVSAWRFWMSRGLLAEGSRWLALALDACAERPALRARALFGSAVLDVRRGEGGALRDIGAEIVQLNRGLGDPEGIAQAGHDQATLTYMAGAWSQADEMSEATLAAAAGLPTVRASVEHLGGVMCLARGRTGEARARLASAMSALDGVPRQTAAFFSTITLGWIVDDRGPVPHVVLEETMLLGRRVGAEQARAHVLTTLATTAQIEGELDEALRHLDAARRIFGEIGDPHGDAMATARRGHILLWAGELVAAERDLTEALERRRALRDRRASALTLGGLALVTARGGQPDRARALARKALALLEWAGDRAGIAGALGSLGVIELIAGVPADAARLTERSLLAGSQVPGMHRCQGWQHAVLALLYAEAGDPARATGEHQVAETIFRELGDQRGLSLLDRGPLRQERKAGR